MRLEFSDNWSLFFVHQKNFALNLFQSVVLPHDLVKDLIVKTVLVRVYFIRLKILGLLTSYRLAVSIGHVTFIFQIKDLGFFGFDLLVSFQVMEFANLLLSHEVCHRSNGVLFDRSQVLDSKLCFSVLLNLTPLSFIVIKDLMNFTF